jgi:hypothetical protein
MCLARRSLLLAAVAVGVVACDESDPIDPGGGGGGVVDPTTMTVDGWGRLKDRFTAELFVRGNTAYTTTWGQRSSASGLNRGNAIYVWDVSGATPALADSVIVASGATTLGDIAVSDDGRWLVVASESGPLSLLVYDLANPRKPVEVARHTVTGNGGAHTAEIGTVNGKLHAFMALNRGTTSARLSIVDLSTPTAPREVATRNLPTTILHDTHYRDGILFLNLWDEGLTIVDVGGGGRGGSITNPVDIGRVSTAGGNVHNSWWFHDPSTNAKRYVFVGEEGPGAVPATSAGDIHVVDVSNMAQPREVAFFRVQGAGTHNFSVDEARGILYAAYYNGGVRALDIRGDLGTCTDAQKASDGRCDLAKMGREIGRGLLSVNGFAGADPAFIWGVQHVGDAVYASDMANGIWKLKALPRP